MSIAQDGTASTPAAFTLQFSPDGSTFYSGQTYTAPTGAATTNWTITQFPFFRTPQDHRMI